MDVQWFIMDDSVLIRSFGDSMNLRILSFFIENPFDRYSINQISEFSEISRNSVYKYLPTFLEKDYLVKEKKGERDVFKLNQSSRIVQLLDRFVDNVGDIELQPQLDEEKIRKNIGMGATQICEPMQQIAASYGSA